MMNVKNLRTGYHKTEIVHGIDFTVQRGDFVCIIGANGCGKTTALKGILGLLPLFNGKVSVDGRDLIDSETNHMAPAKDRAKIFAYIPQVHGLSFPFIVADVVLLGRTPHLASSVAGPAARDKEAAYEAMERLGIETLARIPYTELSGGQQQLVLIARALAQEPRILIMDEPTASLDFGNQHMVLESLKDLVSGGMSIIMVTHDPHHVLYCANKVIVMDGGVILRTGSPDETVTSATLREIFGMRAEVASVKMESGEERKTVIPI